jgi:hypothetical protein
MELLLNDSSVLLNLLAADCLGSIASDTGWQFAICPAVRDEVKKLRDAQTGEMIEVDVTPYIASGLLQLLELSGEEEQTLYVEQSIVVDDGEAMSIAITVHRHLALAIDDKQATNHTHRNFPEIRLWSTPEILRHWTEVGCVSAEVLAEAIRLIETRARYFPAQSHALADWWRQSKDGGATKRQ